MFLTPHAAVGAAIATSLTGNPIISFGIGWLSHYLADSVPHGDERLGVWASKGDEVKRLLGITAIDAVIWIAVLSYVFLSAGFSSVILAAAVGSAVPDVMWGLEKVMKRELFGPLRRFHGWNHNFFRVNLPLWTGFIGQGIVTAVMWVAILT